jgi:tetratricopeptide (TPR) repeat protein
MTRRRRVRDDLGLAAVERIRTAMQVDPEWSAREARGFTWWGAWVRERVWADEAVDSDDITLWHVRARTPALRDQPDEAATYLLVGALNELAAMSAYVYDPDDGTVSARCGAFLYADVAPWLERFLGLAVALQPSIAWQQVPILAAGRPLDDAPHPGSGPRSDPDDMLNLAVQQAPGASPFTPAALHEAFVALEADGLHASWDPSGHFLTTLVPLTADEPALWAIGSSEHPVLGPGAFVALHLPLRIGPVQASWVANALNAAEAADWHGETRPHALGRWSGDGGFLSHALFCPAAMLSLLDRDDALLLLRDFLAWGGARASFAGERLPWLLAAARSRFPDDELAEADEAAEADEPAEADTAPEAGAERAEPGDSHPSGRGRAAVEPDPSADPDPSAGTPTDGFDPENWGYRMRMPGERAERDERARPNEPTLPDPFDFLRQGRPLDAVAAVRPHMAMARENLRRMHQFRSEILTDLERWDEALVDIDAALALAPVGDELVSFVGTRGWVLTRLGRLAEGLAELERALAIGTMDALVAARLHVNRGLALSRMGDTAGALVEYDHAERLAPDDAIVHYDRACVLSQLGRLPGAFGSLRIGLSLDCTYRPRARHDEDLANLRDDAAYGPRFRELVGADD